MNIYIYRNEKEYGPYDLDQIRGFLASGDVTKEDHCRVEGDTEQSTIFIRLGGLISTQAPAVKPDDAWGWFDPANKEELEPITSRYSSAYLIARLSVRVGNFLVTGGFVLGAAIAALGILYALCMFFGSNPGLFAGLCFVSVVSGTGIAIPIIVGGVTVQAVGQALMACLDIAVNTSPFLDNAQKSSVMQIKPIKGA